MKTVKVEKALWMCGGKGVVWRSKWYLSMEYGVLDAFPTVCKRRVGGYTWEGRRQRRRKGVYRQSVFSSLWAISGVNMPGAEVARHGKGS